MYVPLEISSDEDLDLLMHIQLKSESTWKDDDVIWFGLIPLIPMSWQIQNLSKAAMAGYREPIYDYCFDVVLNARATKQRDYAALQPFIACKPLNNSHTIIAATTQFAKNSLGLLIKHFKSRFLILHVNCLNVSKR